MVIWVCFQELHCYTNTLCGGQLVRPSWKEKENSIGADWGGHSRLPPTDSISVGVCACACAAYCRVTSLYICVTPHYRQATTAFWAYCGLKPIWYGIHNLFCFCQSANKYYFIFKVSSQILITRCTDLSTCQMYKWSKIYLTFYLMQLLPACTWTRIINKVAHFHCLPVLFALLLLLMLLSSLVTCFVMHELIFLTEIIQWLLLLFCFVPKV